MTADLKTLSDHELLLNVALTVCMAVDELGVDTDTTMQSVIRFDAPDAPEQVCTLADILAEVERRTGATFKGEGFTGMGSVQ